MKITSTVAALLFTASSVSAYRIAYLLKNYQYIQQPYLQQPYAQQPFVPQIYALQNLQEKVLMPDGTLRSYTTSTMNNDFFTNQ